MSTYLTYYTKMKLNNFFIICLLILLTFVLLIFSLNVGATNNNSTLIILYARLPRILGALLCGSSLAVAGLLLQLNLNNSLASPTTIGINSGAGLFVISATLLFPNSFFLKTFAGFFGALITSFLVYAIAYKTGSSRMTIILSGVAISSLCNSFIDMLTILYPDVLIDKNAFYIGGVLYTTYTQLKFATPFVLFSFIGCILLGKQINILTLGDDIATSLGVNVKKVRFLSIAYASILASSAVSISGLLGFVGLIVPHIVLKCFKNDAKFLIPITAFFGGNLVLLCDTLARIIFKPFEVPVGILLSTLGAPFFLYLILKGGKRGRFR